MIVSLTHACGHAYDHVLYGTQRQLLRQRKELVESRCPDCFRAKVIDALTAYDIPARTDERAWLGPGRGHPRRPS